jgi:glyceraldehyde-3-phosphate dehydrogenase/erythrose-4-phosphate dehydrogenase
LSVEAACRTDTQARGAMTSMDTGARRLCQSTNRTGEGLRSAAYRLVLAEEAQTQRYAGVLGVSGDPLVSSDILGDRRPSVVDLELTKVVDGDLVKVMSSYDNEWGFANQMVREALSVTSKR